jgi:hypothetical protein
MINITIRVENGKILDTFENKDTLLHEAGLAVYALELFKQRILDMQFKSDMEIEE